MSNQFSAVLLLFALLSVSYTLEASDKARNLINGQKLVSPQRIFELGFFTRGTPAKWYIGIWYAFSTDTVVWVANRDQPMNDSTSTLAISEGALVLIGSLNSTIRLYDVNSSLGNEFDPLIQLLDTGNLVIKDQNRVEILWQSFDYPTNTMLPGMKIGTNLSSGFEWYLSSWKRSDDPSTGNYCYKMDTRGQPEIVLWNGNSIVYKSGAWVGSRFSGLPEMATYKDIISFAFVSGKDEVSYSFHPQDGVPVRVVLNETGKLQRMRWDPTGKVWSEYWFWPNDMCDSYRKCGPFGICNMNEAPICDCLPGFTEKSTREWSMRNTSGGCKRKTPLICQPDSNGFKLVQNVKLPDTESGKVDENIKDCKRRCLTDCSCLAYSLFNIGGGTGCVTWSNELVDIRYVIEDGQDLYVKLDKSELAVEKKKAQLLIGTIGTSIGLILLSLTVFLIYRRCQRTQKMGVAFLGKTRRYSNENSHLQNSELPIYDLEKVIAATANFSEANKLGQGGFGIVYKGVLPNGDEIAVKRLSRNSSQGLNEFMNEVMLIAKLQHRNLVRLLGCCIHGSERMLIYEFMPNKSLDFVIFDNKSRELLSWTMRLVIIKGISRGILYLHQDSRLNIIHRDLKAANVLLDDEMMPKISDFGIARLFKQEENEMDTERVVGTRGYMSPEYAMEGKFSVKSDVYSFGVLLLEIISGKRNQGNHNLLAHAWHQWQEGNIVQLADEAIESPITSEIVRFVHVGLLCVQECANDRPTMSAVVSMLANEGCSLPEPKKPVLSTKITPTPELVFDSANELTVTEVDGR